MRAISSLSLHVTLDLGMVQSRCRAWSTSRRVRAPWLDFGWRPSKTGREK